MARPLFADTDVLVDYLRGRPRAVRFVTTHGDRLALSSVVIAELYAGVQGAAELVTLDAFVAIFRASPVTAQLARAGGLLKRDFAPAHGLGLGDAILAATVLSEDGELATLNVRHYPMFQGLRPAYAKR